MHWRIEVTTMFLEYGARPADEPTGDKELLPADAAKIVIQYVGKLAAVVNREVRLALTTDKSDPWNWVAVRIALQVQ